MDDKSELKIAMLGAARIGRWGIVKPAQEVTGVQLYAVAARDNTRARDYAGRYNIPVVHSSYEDMLADPNVDAVYNPLPNGLHCEWTIKALDAGKHVLCEKPFSSNADEARQMAAAASRNNKVLMEALHYRFHPMATRMQSAVAELGSLRHIETNMCIPLPMMNDIRYDYGLGGGAAMDVGAYAVSLMRFLAEASADPLLAVMPEIVAVDVKLRRKNVDRAMKVDVRWPNGTTGRLHFSLWSAALLKMSAKVVGEKGELDVLN
ncbi:MAG: Gfo/Idh/MocA family protein, partial [Spongiibacteraceae bacterium]